jgi:hypothetical protein
MFGLTRAIRTSRAAVQQQAFQTSVPPAYEARCFAGNGVVWMGACIIMSHVTMADGLWVVKRCA